MTTWIKGKDGNKCSVEWFGSEEAAYKALASLKNCENCTNCSGCLRCSGCSDCLRCLDCSGCSHCSGCSRCSRCSRCSYCSRCSGVLQWTGPKVDGLIAINGLYWPVSISITHLQIGCRNYTLDNWEAFDDEVIDRMDPGQSLKFWKAHKAMIMGVAKGVNHE